MDYSILLPAPVGTITQYSLKSTVAYIQWIQSGTDDLTPRPDGAIEAISMPLSPWAPTAVTQRLIAESRKIQREAELKRPACLSPASLADHGYDLDLGDRAPANIIAVAKVIQNNPKDYDNFIAAKAASNLDLIDLIYPSANFRSWRETQADNPMDLETLTNFASAQVEAFLQGSPSLLASVSQ